jgi:hypothetical protein
MARDWRVEIHPQSGGGHQVDDPNSISQSFVAHDFLLTSQLLFTGLNVAIHREGVVNKSDRSYEWFVQIVRRKPCVSRTMLWNKAELRSGKPLQILS